MASAFYWREKYAEAWAAGRLCDLRVPVAGAYLSNSYACFGKKWRSQDEEA
jgi:hypothetical protein